MLYIGGAISSGTIHSSSVRSSWLRVIRRGPSAKRPSISQASAIITAPVVVIVSDTVWMRDGRLSSRTPNVGSCTTGRAPAPSAPMRHQDGAGGPEQPGAAHRAQFGVVEGRADGPFVAVPAGDRRAQGALAGGHHSTLTAGSSPIGRRRDS